MPTSSEDVFYDPDSDLFVLKEGGPITDKTRIAHPLSVTIQPIVPDPAGIPLSNISPLSAVTGEPDWSRLIGTLSFWKVRRFHLIQAEIVSPSDLRTISNAVQQAKAHLVLSFGESPIVPDMGLPVPSRIHLPVSHASSQERFDLLGQLTVAGHRVRALTILDPNDYGFLHELGTELTVKGIQEWTISPPFGSPDAHWLFDASYPEPPFITQMKKQFPWIRIEHACFPVREGSLIVQSDGAIFTTEPATGKRIFLVWLKEMGLPDLLAKDAFDQRLHLMSWLQGPKKTEANTAAPLLPAKEKDFLFDAFACYDNDDWQEVNEIVSRLEESGVRLWIDKNELRPGTPWNTKVAQIINKIPAMLVFFGKKGTLREYQIRESNIFLQAAQEKPLIPVILECAPAEVDIPANLEIYSRIDLRPKDPASFDRLVWGITGKKPPGHSLG